MFKEKCQKTEGGIDYSSHWDKNFKNREVQNWIETGEPAILKWFERMEIPKNAKIFCAGVGDSNIVSYLLKSGYHNIVANDISKIALNKLANNVDHHPGVSFVIDNLIAPSYIPKFHNKIDVFIDRATLHFFTEPADQAFYFNQLSDLLKPNGYYMCGVFGLNNRPKCCGLNLHLWSEEAMKNKLQGYQIHDTFEQAFVEGNGNVRNYLYTLAQKN